MVTDFQRSSYNEFISYWPVILSDIEDEMIPFIEKQISDLRAGKYRNSIRDQIAMCIYETLTNISGNPDYDYLDISEISNLIHNFNRLTNSTVTINFN